MGVNLILKKGEQEIDFGRAYHYDEDKESVQKFISGIRSKIILTCAHNDKEEDILELFEELEEESGRLALIEFMEGLKEEGYKEVRQ